MAKRKKIKTIRFVIQLLLFTVCLLMFFSVITDKRIIQIYNAFYIFPTLSSLFWKILPPFILVTLFVLALPVFVGRVYCAYFCPVGFFQDMIKALSDRLKIKKNSSRNWYGLRMFILFLCLFLLVKQSFYYGYLDHYSNFGRVLSLFNASSFSAFAAGFIFLLIIGIVPLFRPRWFCTHMCPSGALFELVGKRAFFSILTSDKCNACGVCEPVCPTLCIEQGEVDYDRCINCFECIENCPQNALNFSPVPFKTHLRHLMPTSANRRKFFFQGAFSIIGLGAGRGLKKYLPEQKKEGDQCISPPGAWSSTRFISKCSSCHFCVSVCPTNVLIPTGLENGVYNYLKPKMDYNRSYCSYECNACLGVCPSMAITYFPLEQKKQIKIGSARLNKKTCIPYVKKKDCAACAEHCPTGAVVMEKHKPVNLPVLKNEFCIGCGACQHACPIEPERAIIVVPEPIHTLAYNPKPKKEEDKIKLPEITDFPF